MSRQDRDAARSELRAEDFYDKRPPALAPRAQERMTAAQASYLKALSYRRGETFDPTMTKYDAMARISQLRAGGRSAAALKAALNTPCPYCHAVPLKPCRRSNGRPRRTPHQSRYKASQTQARPL